MLDQTAVTRLDNGVTVATTAIPNAQSISVGLFVKAGGRYEKRTHAGVSHFLEHMLFKGTPRRTALEISRSVEGCGGYLNAFTNEESTCYHADAPFEHLGRVYKVLIDMFLNATIDAQEFAREREVIIEEIKMYDDHPDAVARENMQAALFPNHPLGAPLAGDEPTLRRMTPQTLHDYKAHAYTPSATIVAFAGRLKHEECVKLVAQTIGDKPSAPGLTFRRVTANQTIQRLTVARKDIAQVRAAIGFRTFGRRDKRRFPLDVLNVILGGNMSSRLFQSVRERNGLCYSIGSFQQRFADSGIFTIAAGFDAERCRNALRLTAKEVHRLMHKAVGQTELQRAKEYLVGQYRLGLESVNAHMIYLATSLLARGKVVNPTDYLTRWQAVTREDVLSVANDIFDPTRMNISLVTPHDHPVSDDQWLEAFSPL